MHLNVLIMKVSKPSVPEDGADFHESLEPFGDEVESQVACLSSQSCKLTFPVCAFLGLDSEVVGPIAAF